MLNGFPMKPFTCWLLTSITILLGTCVTQAQQLKLGTNPYTVNKSAVLELSSTNQGLLLVRISDTNLINVMAPPDGMLIYFTPTKQMYARSNGYWKALTYAENITSQWLKTGNTGINSATEFLGTLDDKALVLRSFNSAFAEFGRRQTLGLTQAYTDYDNNNEQVFHLRSALQFYAPGAEFYKPKMFVDANGNFRIKGSAAGTDYFELGSTGTSNSGGFEFIIGDDGDEAIVFKSYDYVEGMSEMMRLQSGRMAVGSNSFDVTNPEKLLIDAGTTESFNLMTGKGSINNYLQINVQNRSAGNTASSDLVATSNNGTETTNFVNLGINSSGYSNTSYPILNGANNAYLYTTGSDFVIGNGTAAKTLRFFTGGFATANERMRISATGQVGIGTLAPSTLMHIKTGVANDAGLRLENLTSTSTMTSDAAVIGVDPTGKVVRTKTPTYYSGTGTAAVNEITKVWVAEVSNTATGIITVTIPANIGFATIVSAQVTAKGGSAITNYPVATIVSNSTTSIVIKVLESKTTAALSSSEGFESHNDTNTKVYIRLEGY
ncbi:hypothetical protein [Flavitalea sp.]|nr:hypothetical protein [Flavitalea sp.]